MMVKRKSGPRPANTYRAARRNAVLRGEPRGTWRGAEAKPEMFAPRITLNRSRRWKRASTYAAARALAPFPERVVR